MDERKPVAATSCWTPLITPNLESPESPAVQVKILVSPVVIPPGPLGLDVQPQTRAEQYLGPGPGREPEVSHSLLPLALLIRQGHRIKPGVLDPNPFYLQRAILLLPFHTG